MTFDFRPYQAEVVDKIDVLAQSETVRNPLVVAPTGSGKTVIAAEVIRRMVERNQRVLMIAHRRELITQAHNKLYELAGIDAGIILAGHEMRLNEPVQIASIQSLLARAIRANKIDLPPADLIVVDEAHHIRAKSYRKLIEAYPNAMVLGLTATPCRGDGRGLGNVFDRLIECPPVDALIELGFLVRTKVYAPYTPNLKGVKVQRGDYVEGALSERMNRPKLVADITETWLRLAERRKTICFASSVAHSVAIRDAFRKADVWAEHVDGGTPVEEREEILRRLSDGAVEIVTNYGVLTEGFDCPAASCLILARPTKHHGLYRQMAGRVLRPAPGKGHALVLDHAGATFQHGFVEDPVNWTLSEDRRAELPAQVARFQGHIPSLTKCPECSAARMEGKECPACGWRPQIKPKPVVVADGELAHLDRKKGLKGDGWTAEERAVFMAELMWVARDRGYNPNWASHQYKARFGEWPPWEGRNRITPPSQATLSWVKSRMIAFAKARDAARKRGAA